MITRIIVTLAAVVGTLAIQTHPGPDYFWWGPATVAWILTAREWANALP